MPKRRPVLPDADDFPELDSADLFGTDLDEDIAADLPLKAPIDPPMTAEKEVAHSVYDLAVSPFEHAPGLNPLDFDDGGEMGRRHIFRGGGNAVGA